MSLILLPGPLATNGDKQEIPLLQDSATPNRMSFDKGTPAICSEDPNEGGLPPRRADMNQVHFILSNNFYELQKGAQYTFDVFMTQAPNTGYPNGAILWDPNTKQYLQSNKDNNTDNYITTPSFIGASWMPFLATPTQNGNMSAADKEKLDGIQAGAQVNAVTSVNGQTGAVTGLANIDLDNLSVAGSANIRKQLNLNYASFTQISTAVIFTAPAGGEFVFWQNGINGHLGVCPADRQNVGGMDYWYFVGQITTPSAQESRTIKLTAGDKIAFMPSGTFSNTGVILVGAGNNPGTLQSFARSMFYPYANQ